MSSVNEKPRNYGNSITPLLVRLGEGNHEVEARLIPQVNGELRRVARSRNP